MVTKTPTRAAPARAAKPNRALLLRPMASVRRIALFEREVRERLSPSAFEMAVTRAEIISEGQRAIRSGKDVYFGSTMLTIDLETLRPLLREPCDAASAARLALLFEKDAAARSHVKAIAAREVERVTQARPKRVNAEVKVRASGARVFMDVDVEGTF